jgi:small subunit ribosomal protein S7e
MSAANKILRTANAPTTSPDETELSVAQALIDLENNVPELKAELRPLQISAAREVDVRGGKKAIVIFVPVPQLKAFRKVQQRSVALSLFSRILLEYSALKTHPGTREKVL